MMKLNTWIENHKIEIAELVNAISIFLWLVGLFLSRTLGGAATIMLYMFFSATPETTVYQLSQFAHADNFWLTSFTLAIAYSAIYTSYHGTIGGSRQIVRFDKDGETDEIDCKYQTKEFTKGKTFDHH